MNESEIRELLSRLTYIDKLILREMLTDLLQRREPEDVLPRTAV